LNQFFPKKPNRNRSVWPGFGFFFNFFFRFGYFYLIKTEPNQKWSSLVYTCFIMKGIYFLKCFKVINFCCYQGWILFLRLVASGLCN
jgi:hypothetical protein